MPPRRAPGVNTGPAVMRGGRALAVSADHPLAGAPEVTASVLAGHELAYADLPAWYVEYGLPQPDDDLPPQKLRPVPTGYLEHILRRVSQDGTLAHLVPAGIVLPRADPSLRTVPVTDLPHLEVRAVWPDPAPSPHCGCFARRAAEHGAASGWLDPGDTRSGDGPRDGAEGSRVPVGVHGRHVTTRLCWPGGELAG